MSFVPNDLTEGCEAQFGLCKITPCNVGIILHHSLHIFLAKVTTDQVRSYHHCILKNFKIKRSQSLLAPFNHVAHLMDAFFQHHRASYVPGHRRFASGAAHHHLALER